MLGSFTESFNYLSIITLIILLIITITNISYNGTPDNNCALITELHAYALNTPLVKKKVPLSFLR